MKNKNKKYLLTEARLVFFAGTEGLGNYQAEPNDLINSMQENNEVHKALKEAREFAKQRRDEQEQQENRGLKNPDLQLEEELSKLPLSKEEIASTIETIYHESDEEGILLNQKTDFQIHKIGDLDLGKGKILKNVAVISINQKTKDGINTRGEKVMKDIVNKIKPTPSAIIFMGDKLSNNQGNILIYQPENNVIGLGYFEENKTTTLEALGSAIDDLVL